MTIQKNILHYYVDLLRMEDGEERIPEQSESCVTALHNVIRTMKKSRKNIVCGEDFTYLDWGTISFDNIDFSYNGKAPCDFSHSKIKSWNLAYGHQDRVRDFFYIPYIDKIMTFSNKEIIFWDLQTNLPNLIINSTEFGTECEITTVTVIPEEKVFAVGTDNGNLYIRSFDEPQKNLFVQRVGDEILIISFSAEAGKLLTVNRKQYYEEGKRKEIRKINCWSVNQFKFLKHIWSKTIFDAYGNCDVTFSAEIIAVSHYSYDDRIEDRITVTETIDLNTGEIIEVFHDEDSFSKPHLSINGEVFVLQLYNSNSVSVHYINSEKQSCILDDSELLRDSTPFSYDSSGLFFTRNNQIWLFDLISQTEIPVISLPDFNPDVPRERVWEFKMTLNNDYCLIWDQECETYLINFESETIDNIDVQDLSSFDHVKFCSELNQFIIVDDHTLITIDPNNMKYCTYNVSNSDSPHRLIATENTCIFLLLNEASMEVDLQTGKTIHEFTHYDNDLIAISSYGSKLLSSYYHDYSLEDWVVYTTTLINGTNEISLPFHKEDCTAACFSSDSEIGVSASSDATAIWNSSNGRIVELYLRDSGEDVSVTSLAISRDKKYIAYISTSESYDDDYRSRTIVTVLDRTHNQPLKTLHLENFDDSYNTKAQTVFLENSDCCFIACEDGRIIIWNHKNNDILYEKTIAFPKEYEFCMDLSISSNGKHIVYDMDNRTACVVDISTITSETSYNYKTIHYLPNLHLSKCVFKGCKLDTTARNILYQYGAITNSDDENKS